MNRNAESIPRVAWQYWGIIKFMQQNPGMYHMDRMREECHEELCNEYRIDKSVTQLVTDHLDKYGDVIEMHDALKKLSVKRP